MPNVVTATAKLRHAQLANRCVELNLPFHLPTPQGLAMSWLSEKLQQYTKKEKILGDGMASAR